MHILLLGLTLLLAGCAATYQARCSALGWMEGTPDHAACSERERERTQRAIQEMGRGISESARPPARRGMTCYPMGAGMAQCY